jgi:hypothetical protein
LFCHALNIFFRKSSEYAAICNLSLIIFLAY